MHVLMAVISALVLTLTAPTAEQLQNGALDARRGIKRGELRVDAKTRQFEGDAITERESWWVFAFDENKLRCDYHQGGEYVHKSVLSGDDFISHLSDSNTTGSFLVKMGSVLHHDGNFPGLFHPLVLGMVSASVGHLYSHSEDTQVGRFLDRPSTVAFDTNANAYRIDYVFDDESTLRVWVDTERGYSVIRIERASQFQHERLLDAVSSEVVQRNGVWFPSKVTWRRSHGDALLVEEVLIIRDAVFNQDVDHVAFTLAGMDIPAGTHIQVVQNGSAIWDGSKMIRRNSIPDTIDTQNSHRGWTVLFAVVFMGTIVGTVLIVIFARRKGA